MHYPFYSCLLLFFIGTFNLAHAKGENCEGAAQCENAEQDYDFDNLPQGFFQVLANGTEGPYAPGGPVRANAIYYEGDHIVCVRRHNVGAMCSFLEGNVPSEGANASLVTKKHQELYSFGCQSCGSVPLSYNDNNPNTMGVLKIDYVLHKDCQGLCPLRNGESAAARNQSEAVVLDWDESHVPYEWQDKHED